MNHSIKGQKQKTIKQLFVEVVVNHRIHVLYGIYILYEFTRKIPSVHGLVTYM